MPLYVYDKRFPKQTDACCAAGDRLLEAEAARRERVAAARRHQPLRGSVPGSGVVA